MACDPCDERIEVENEAIADSNKALGLGYQSCPNCGADVIVALVAGVGETRRFASSPEYTSRPGWALGYDEQGRLEMKWSPTEERSKYRPHMFSCWSMRGSR
jgi:hypothetical protein